MYVDVRRHTVFFDQTDRFLAQPGLVRYDPASGQLSAVPGAQAGDVVNDVSRDGNRLALASADWVTVRNASRTRLTFVTQGAVAHQTDKFLSFWSRFDPSGRFALVSAFNGKRRPVVIDLDAGESSDPIARDLDARFGDVDPLDGRLWAPDERAKDSVLAVDCRSGDIQKVRLPLGEKVARVRFARDGAALFATAANNRLLCCDRDGAVRWSRDIGEYGDVRAGNIFFNEDGTCLCLPLSETPRSNWGEDLVIDARTGAVDNAILRHRGPPARLASDWFGDRLLTHGGEIVDFHTGAVVERLAFGPVGGE
ncbi:YncE family protein [Achromobacter sp. NCFB-sbj8-Ac1-l]|uniref:YncE family protein n=1 Tax=unclassified Achromobacter TaxID=2626865 RepID=UPI004046CE3D